VPKITYSRAIFVNNIVKKGFMFLPAMLTLSVLLFSFSSSLPAFANHTPVSEIKSLKSLSANYDIFLIDVIGVMHDGKDPYKKAVDCVNNLISNGKFVIFVSNNPRPGELTKKKLLSFGIKQPFEVITSGDVARTLLSTQYKDKKIYHLGADRNKDISHKLNLQITEDIHQSDLVLLTAFLEPEECLSKHIPLLDEIIRLDIPVLCANPDKIAPHGDKVRLCAGAIADYLISHGAKVTYTGKPDKVIFESLSSIFPHVDFKKNRMIMMGDTLETDIQGANNFGIDSLLVLSGNTGEDLEKQNINFELYVKRNNTLSPLPRFYMDYLNW
jgi:HAD superfamily hydrolase (TIGR01459 family)